MSSDGDILTLLDACAVINFAATRHLEQILSTISGRVAITEVVEREALYVKRGGGGDDHEERERIDLSLLVQGGLLEVLSPYGDDEYLTFIDYAVELDDGESMTLALAEHRNGIVVTDDRKAIRLAPDSLKVRSSLSVIKTWVDSESVGRDMQREVLLAVRERASYAPGKNHALREWWDSVLYGN